MANKLIEKIEKLQYSKALQRCEGLDSFLDLMPVEQTEYLLFLRKESLLSYKITQRLDSRSLTENLVAMLSTTKSNFCHICLETRGGHGIGCPNALI